MKNSNDVSFEQIESLVKGMSPLMDPELSVAEFNDAFDRIEEEKLLMVYILVILG